MCTFFRPVEVVTCMTFPLEEPGKQRCGIICAAENLLRSNTNGKNSDSN